MVLLSDIYYQNINDFLNYEILTEKIKYSVFIISLLFVFIFIWIPYLKNLNIKIWRTKGMLNMIPLEIVMKHENLKNTFIYGNILQAVK